VKLVHKPVKKFAVDSLQFAKKLVEVLLREQKKTVAREVPTANW
jgi:hypothetical protein